MSDHYVDNFSVRNNVIFEKFAVAMVNAGYQRNAKQCQNKIKHLREKYRNYKDKVSRSGAGASNPPKFFDKIDEVLGTRPQTRPEHLLDSGSNESFDNFNEDDSWTTSRKYERILQFIC